LFISALGLVEVEPFLGFAMLTDGLDSLRSIITAGFSHGVVDLGREHPHDLSLFHLLSILLGNLKTNFPLRSMLSKSTCAPCAIFQSTSPLQWRFSVAAMADWPATNAAC
jgi:hypothetical protein